MDMTLTSASYAQSAFGMMGSVRHPQNDLSQVQSTVLDEVVEVVQAGYDLSREVTLSRSEKKTDERSEDDRPAVASGSDDAAAERPEALQVASASLPTDKGRAVDLIA